MLRHSIRFFIIARLSQFVPTTHLSIKWSYIILKDDQVLCLFNSGATFSRATDGDNSKQQTILMQKAGKINHLLCIKVFLSCSYFVVTVP